MKKILIASVACVFLLLAGCKFTATTIDRNQMADLTAKNGLQSATPSKGVTVTVTKGIETGPNANFTLEFKLGEDPLNQTPVKLDFLTVTADNFKLYKITNITNDSPAGTATGMTISVSAITDNKVKIVFDNTGITTDDYLVYADASKIRFANSALLMNGNQNTVAGEAEDSHFEFVGTNAADLKKYRKLFYDEPIFPFNVSGQSNNSGDSCVVGSTSMLVATGLTMKPEKETVNSNIKFQKWNYETAEWNQVSAVFNVNTDNTTMLHYVTAESIPAMSEKDVFRLVTDHPEAIQYTTGITDKAGLATISGMYEKTGVTSIPSTAIETGSGTHKSYAGLNTITESGLTFKIVSDTYSTTVSKPAPAYLEVTVSASTALKFPEVLSVWEKIKAGNTAAARTVQFYFPSTDNSGSIALEVNYSASLVKEKTETKSVIRFPITNVYAVFADATPEIFVSNNFTLPRTLASGTTYKADVYPFATKSPAPSDYAPFPAKNWSKLEFTSIP